MQTQQTQLWEKPIKLFSSLRKQNTFSLDCWKEIGVVVNEYGWSSHRGCSQQQLTKPELVQIILNTEANLGSQIAKLTTEVKDLLLKSKTF